MIRKLFCIALLGLATVASAQEVYRTVTGNGKVIYSDTPIANDSSSKPSQTKTYSLAELGAANSMPGPDGPGSGESGGRACRADAQRFCPQSREPKQAFECLLDHQQDISDACYNALKNRMQSGQNQPAGGGGDGQACRQDAQQLCKGVQPGGGRIVDCLLDHQKDLSDACYDSLAKKMQGGQRR